METALQVKNVDFYGDTLLAIQENATQTIYVAINYILRGLGFNDKQTEYQRDKITSDKVIAKGTQKFSGTLLNMRTGKDVWCISLFKLPLALAKISITPKMQKETPQLADKLERYQDTCADVLAKAFLPEQYQNNSVLSIEQMNSQLQNIENRFDSFQNSFDLFQTNIITHIDTRLNTMGNAFTYIQKLLEQNSKPLFVVDADWKSKMFKRVDELLLQQPQKYINSKAILKSIYDKMNSVYGIVWDQESRDFRIEHNIVGRPQTMELISDKEQLKSLFECILNDMFENKSQKAVSEKVMLSVRDIIAPLIQKYNDKSKGGTVTYRKVYKNMDVNWYRKEKAYIKCHRANNPPQRIKLIEQDFKLMNRFKKTVKGMMTES